MSEKDEAQARYEAQARIASGEDAAAVWDEYLGKLPIWLRPVTPYVPLWVSKSMRHARRRIARAFGRKAGTQLAVSREALRDFLRRCPGANPGRCYFILSPPCEDDAVCSLADQPQGRALLSAVGARS